MDEEDDVDRRGGRGGGGDLFVAESYAGRVRVLRAAPGAGKAETNEVFAEGLRRPFGTAVHPRTGELWASVNERDGLGDDLVPDYVTRVRDGGFYGWPWFYLGPNQDPRHPGARPELRPKVIAPDVLLQSHSASLEMAFYTGRQFPREYEHDAFAALHGSWNRAKRTGYKVVRVPQRNGVPTGEYEDFLTGFVTERVFTGAEREAVADARAVAGV